MKRQIKPNSFPVFDSEKPCDDALPIIYSPHYNMSVFGIEKLHPFDSFKYEKIFKYLTEVVQLLPRQFYKPYRISDNELLLAHTPEYLASLNKSNVIARIIEIKQLKYIPNVFLRHRILEPMRLATGGTVLGVRLALQYGWAVNLSGGYHHAKSNEGGGFNIFADIPVSLRSIWKEKPDLKVLIVDLDAHQGNGNSSILGNDPRVVILDMFNASIYPCDVEAQSMVKYKVPLQHRTNDAVYLDSLKKWLPVAIADQKPDIIIYNAGTDVFRLDPLGNLAVTEQGIIDRDNYVFDKALENEIPILMVLSGGYHMKSGEIIAKSIEKILKTHKEIKSVP